MTIATILRREPRPAPRGRTGPTTRPLRLRPRSAIALLLVSGVGLIAFIWPLLVSADSPLARTSDAPLLFALLLPLLLAVVLAELAEGGMDAKSVAMLGVLAAVGAALRPLGTGVAGFEPMFFLLVLAGRAFGPGFGFVLGATTLFASALITAGVGPWLPFQMLGAAWVAAGAGLLPPARGRLELAIVAAYGAVAGLFYGLAMNLSFWPFVLGGGTSISFVAGDPVADNLRRFVAFTAVTSLGFDIPRALLTAILVLVTGRTLLTALRRAGRRAAFEAPIAFAPDRSATIADESAQGSGRATPGPTEDEVEQRTDHVGQRDDHDPQELVARLEPVVGRADRVHQSPDPEHEPGQADEPEQEHDQAGFHVSLPGPDAAERQPGPAEA